MLFDGFAWCQFDMKFLIVAKYDRQPIWAQSSARRINQQQRKHRPNGGSQKNPMSR
jgi:hypothetical protein